MAGEWSEGIGVYVFFRVYSSVSAVQGCNGGKVGLPGPLVSTLDASSCSWRERDSRPGLQRPTSRATRQPQSATGELHFCVTRRDTSSPQLPDQHTTKHQNLNLSPLDIAKMSTPPEQPKSILKKTHDSLTSPSDDLPTNLKIQPKSDAERKRLEVAVQHARLIQEQKAIMIANLDAIEELSEYPASDTPTEAEINAFLGLRNAMLMTGVDIPCVLIRRGSQ